MIPVDKNFSDIYEGNEPYVFVSYSHKDQLAMLSVKRVLDENNIRYWYDKGLHSGNDWNMVISKHLEAASVCILILSPNSANSEYVKNELVFAVNHRIPVNIIRVKQFPLPSDMDMLTGRIHMIEMSADYSRELVCSLPFEVFFDSSHSAQKTDLYAHPMFEVSDYNNISQCQGTKFHLATHKRLGYDCVVLEETFRDDEIATAEDRFLTASRIDSELFPKIIDYTVRGNKVLVYYDVEEIVFLDDYMLDFSLSEEEIIDCIVKVVEGVSEMFSMNLAFRDFARGSMIVTDFDELKFFRAYHPYYGYIKITEETKHYYFEKMLLEISVLLAQLCLEKEPHLPVPIIENERLSKKFLLKVNLIIQKCAKENGSAQYRNFEELLVDLKSASVSGKERSFLKQRAKKLKEYNKIKNERRNIFVSDDKPNPKLTTYESLEEQFGFEGTVVLPPSGPIESESVTTGILICSTGQLMKFGKRVIRIGKESAYCDMVLTQPYISRQHLLITCNEDNTYTLEDLNSVNGTYVLGADKVWKRLQSGKGYTVKKGTIIKLGEAELKIV